MIVIFTIMLSLAFFVVFSDQELKGLKIASALKIVAPVLCIIGAITVRMIVAGQVSKTHPDEL